MLQNQLLRLPRQQNMKSFDFVGVGLCLCRTSTFDTPSQKDKHVVRKVSQKRKYYNNAANSISFRPHLRRNYGTGTRSNMSFSSEHAANQFVRWLLPEERSSLLAALKEYEYEKDSSGLEDVQPTFKQLRLVALSNAIPFVGFGFLDNAIMILAGEYIDHTIGITLGISTMAAAAVGNLISDLMGLGLAGYVEAIAIRFGFDVPPLSTRQASMWKTKYSAYLGRGIGIMIGCIIGMFPLLLIDDTEERDIVKKEMNSQQDDQN